MYRDDVTILLFVKVIYIFGNITFSDRIQKIQTLTASNSTCATYIKKKWMLLIGKRINCEELANLFFKCSYKVFMKMKFWNSCQENSGKTESAFWHVLY